MATSEAPQWLKREQGPGGLEPRSTALPVEARGDEGEPPAVFGYGSPANSATVITGAYSEWSEIVEPGAWSASISSDRNIRSMFNHDPNQLLGSTAAGTLELVEDDQGLHYATTINTEDRNALDVHARVMRGDVDGASVWFRVVREEWTEPTEENGLEMPERRILEASLFEVGPVVFPAFEATSAAARALSPLDSVMRAAGIKSAAKRASLADSILCGDASLDDELRRLFAMSPDLRDAVCGCDLRTADAAPGDDPAAPPASGGLTVNRARLLLGRRPAA